eukprot:9194860-Pyramimonas_sp.AAC.1
MSKRSRVRAEALRTRRGARAPPRGVRCPPLPRDRAPGGRHAVCLPRQRLGHGREHRDHVPQ